MKKLSLILVLQLVVVLITVSAENKVIKTTPDPAKRLQTIEGWGSSICWWGNMVGKFKNEADIDQIVDLITSPNGLNMNIFRFNIGGGDDPTHYSVPGNPGHMAKGKGVRAEMPGYKPTVDGPYDWTADAAQREILLKLKARRSDMIFEAFSNSPPYWMTVSGCAGGHSVATKDNLKPEFEDAFCDYLLEVCKFYQDSCGVKFKTLEAFNEPMSDYWYNLGSQEGCHFDAETQVRVLKKLSPKLASSGLSTVISASDETSLTHFLHTMQVYENDGKVFPLLGQLNTHTYSGTDAERKSALGWSQKTGIRLWQSETGPSESKGTGLPNNLMLAQKMFRDLKIMQPVAWIDWQVLEERSRDWSQISYDSKNESWHPVKNLYVRMQVTRFVRQGYHLIDTDQDNLLLAASPDEKKMVAVLINTDTMPAEWELNLSKFFAKKQAGVNNFQLYRTTKTEDCKLISSTEINIKGKNLKYNAPESSISTFVISLNSNELSGTYIPFR